MSDENPLENALNIEPRETTPEVSDTAKAQIQRREPVQIDLSKFPENSRMIIISDNQNLAILTALDFAKTEIKVAVVDGGTRAWENEGLPMEAGMTNLISQQIDVYLRPYDRQDPKEIEKAMNEYLEWELGLVSQIAQPGGVTFKEYSI